MFRLYFTRNGRTLRLAVTMSADVAAIIARLEHLNWRYHGATVKR